MGMSSRSRLVSIVDSHATCGVISFYHSFGNIQIRGTWFIGLLIYLKINLNVFSNVVQHDLWDVRKHAAAIRQKIQFRYVDGPMVSDKIRGLDGPFHCSIAKSSSKFTLTIVVVSTRLSTELLQKVTWLVFDDFPKYISIRVTVAKRLCFMIQPWF